MTVEVLGPLTQVLCCVDADEAGRPILSGWESEIGSRYFWGDHSDILSVWRYRPRASLPTPLVGALSRVHGLIPVREDERRAPMDLRKWNRGKRQTVDAGQADGLQNPPEVPIGGLRGHLRWAFGGLFLGMVLVGVVWFARSSDSSRLLKVSVGPATLEMQADNMEIRHEELLDSMYTNRFTRGGLMAWLASKQIFAAADPSLVEAIATEVCERLPGDNREERLRLGRDCAGKEVVAELRRRADNRMTPFHYIGDVVTIGVPEVRPPNGRAFACRDGVFWRRTVRLTNLKDNQKFVRVEVDAGHYPCAGGTAPQIQLSEEDAISLFGGPTRRIEEAEAIVVD